MDVAGLSQERAARKGAAGTSNGSRDRGARPARGAGRPESVHVTRVDPVAAETADHLQADYFLRLLTQNRRLIDHRIDEFRKAIATSEAKGDVDAAGNVRRMMLIEEQERQTLDGLIEQLHRRFPRPAPGDAPAIASRTRLVVR